MHKDNFLRVFLPHPETHQKTPLLSWHYLLIYLLLFILLRSGLDLVSVYRPGVLGINSSITVSQVIAGTNIERQKRGLAPLYENQTLSQAATAKAQNMFEENYWAHFSPSGKDPWGFILKSGYKFSYAGENLARNFYNTDEVVSAWMNSPSHRDNILNPNYQDIGIAVVDGVLNGQKTTLVVQMFGKSYEAVAGSPQVNLAGRKISLSSDQIQQPVVAGAENILSRPLVSKALFDPFKLTKIAGLLLMSLVAFLLILDFMILKRRGVFRLSSHHLAHLSLLTLSGASLLFSQVGQIL